MVNLESQSWEGGRNGRRQKDQVDDVVARDNLTDDVVVDEVAMGHTLSQIVDYGAPCPDRISPAGERVLLGG